jgi:heptose-I-phosphate ethanolaminephosphotransferase
MANWNFLKNFGLQNYNWRAGPAWLAGPAAALYALNKAWPLADLSAGNPVFICYWATALLALSALVLLWGKLYGPGRSLFLLLYCAVFVFLKACYLSLAIAGFLSDLTLIFLFIAALQFLLKRLPAKLSFGAKIFICCIHYILLFALATGAVYLIKSHTAGFDVASINSLFQTNLGEISEFYLTQFANFYLVIIILISLLSTMMLYKLISRPLTERNPPAASSGLAGKYRKFALGAVIICALLSTYNAPGQSILNSVNNALTEYAKTADEFKFYAELRSQASSIAAEKEQMGETYMLVIGESASRGHFNAYGYFRPTTPWLSNEVNKNNARLFANAYASFCHTVPSLLNVLTGANQYNGQEPFKAVSLIAAARASGFATYIINAQTRSIMDNPLTVLFEEADVLTYSSQGAASAYDDNILPVLGNIFNRLDQNKNNLIIIFLKGSHFNYAARAPEKFKITFDDNGIDYLGGLSRKVKFVRDLLNPYDQSIYYTDYILSRIYSMLRENVKGPSVFIYMSDHGEDVLGEKFHDASLFTFPMVRVPLALIFSDEYQKRYPRIIDSLDNALAKIFTTDLFFDFMLNIAQIKTGVYDARYDILSPQYTITVDNALTMSNLQNYSSASYYRPEAVKVADDPLLIARQNIARLNNLSPPGRFAALHCDAVALAHDIVDMGFTGAEIKAAPLALPVGMGHDGGLVKQKFELEQYLEAIPLERIEKLYIDLKIFDPEYIEAVLDWLEQLNEKFNLKRRTVIASPVVSPKMRLLGEKGWNVSYYYIPSHMPPSPDTAEFIIRTVLSQQARGLSFPYEVYPFIKEKVEPFLPADIGYHSWDRLNPPGIYHPDMISELKNHPLFFNEKFKTVLLESGSKFYISPAEMKNGG